MKLKEAKEYFKKHPQRDLDGRYYACDTDGTVLGHVEYRKGVVVARKRVEQKMKHSSNKPSDKY